MLGRALVVGDNVDTDQIIAGAHIGSHDEEYLASHCLEALRPGFCEAVSQGDILFAGQNFGCGSSREHAPIALRATGLRAIVVKGVSRIFYRSSANIGLPVFICPEAVDSVVEGVEVDLDLGSDKLTIAGSSFQLPARSGVLLEIAKAGGLVNLMRQRANSI